MILVLKVIPNVSIYNPQLATRTLILLRLPLSDVLLLALCPMLYALFPRSPQPF